jgi:hypothetical protein
METDNREVHIDRDEARAGSTPGVVRYVLGFGLLLVIVAFAIIVSTGMLNADQNNNNQDDTERAVAEQQIRDQQKKSQ